MTCPSHSVLSLLTYMTLNSQSKHVFVLMECQPELIAEALGDDCELAFARWANGKSNGL